MRYTNGPAFFRHLEKASEGHLAKIYAIFASDSKERSFLAQKIFRFLPNIQPKWFSSLQEMQNAIFAPSLFDDAPLYVLEMESLTKKETEILEKIVQREDLYLIFFSGKKHLSFLFQERGVLLDFLPEKKWEKEKRFSEYIQEKAKNLGKIFDRKALEELIRTSVLDLRQLLSEVEKIFCYVGEKKVIELADVLAVHSSSVEKSLWQQAESFVWEKQPVLVDKASCTLFFHALRKQFQMGYSLALFSHPGEGKYLFPKLWPALFEKRATQVKRMGKAYFQKGILLTFFAEKRFRETGVFDSTQLYTHAHFTS